MLVKRLKMVRLASLAFVLMVLITTPGTARVNAGSGTQLSITPGAVNLDSSGTTTLTVEVSNGSNLNAYDLTILYDEEVLVLETWSHGGYLSNLVVIKQVNQPGSLRLVCTQIATPGVSGDGTLLNLIFRALNEGTSNVVLSDVKLSTSNSESVIPSLFGAIVTVSSNAVPTLTMTSIPTFTPTTTLTKVPTISATLPSVTAPTKTRTPTLLVTTPPNRTATGLPPSIFTSTPAGIFATDSTSLVVPPQTDGTPQEGTAVPITTGQVSTPLPVGSDDELLSSEVPDKVDESNTARLNTFLWGSVIFLAVIFTAMILLFIKKKKDAINGSD